MKATLSLCIPTYNRAKFIIETLNSIYSQMVHGVEVIVSDNASEDCTEEIIKDFQCRYANLRYHRWERNMGADENYLKVIEMAEGDFCWFIGSDDIVEVGGIDRVLEAIREHPEATGFSVNRYDYSFDLSIKKETSFGRPQITGIPFSKDVWFKNGEEAFHELCDYFGYIPGQVVQRVKWNEIISSFPIRDYFQAYVHVYIISEMLKRSGNWGYIHQQCIGWREGNDSFLTNGLYYRLSILIESHQKIISSVWGDFPAVERDSKDLILKIHVRNYIGSAYLKTPINQKIDPQFFSKSFIMCHKYYWKSFFFWLNIAPFCFVPRTLVFSARALWRKTRGAC